MDVLDVLRGAGDIGEIAAGRMLAALRLAGGAARVHEEERRLGRHRHRVDVGVPVILDHLVDDEVAARHQRPRARALAGMALPDEDLLDLVALRGRIVARDVGLLLLVLHGAATIVAVHGDQHLASGIDDAVGTGLAAEAAENLGMDDANARAGEHGDRKLRHHRHMQRDAIARLQVAEIAQKCRELVHPQIEFLVGDVLDRLALEFGDEMDRRLVLVFFEMAVDAVIGGVDLAADEPAPKRCVAGIEGFFPVFAPGQKIRVFLEALGKIVQAETLVDVRVGQVRLGNELDRRVVIALFLPMDGDLRFGYILGFSDFLFHLFLPCSWRGPVSAWPAGICNGAVRAPDRGFPCMVSRFLPRLLARVAKARKAAPAPGENREAAAPGRATELGRRPRKDRRMLAPSGPRTAISRGTPPSRYPLRAITCRTARREGSCGRNRR